MAASYISAVPSHVAILISALVLAAARPVQSRIELLHDRCNRFSAATRIRAPVVAGVAGASVLVIADLLHGRDFQLFMQDEHSYAIQMQHLARGSLWMPSHPLGAFFETFHVLNEPVYASVYFPGTALAYVPAVWLDLPLWVLPFLTACLAILLIYLIVSEVLGGFYGFLAVVMMVAPRPFRLLAFSLLSQLPALLFGLLMVWAWLRWFRTRSLRWALVMGAAAGWMAITRPLDALCYAGALAVCTAWVLWPATWQARARFALAVIAAALPFLALQIVQNVGVTGDPLETPFRLYSDRDQPYASLGFHSPPATVRPVSTLPQKQALYYDWILPQVHLHRYENLFKAWWWVRLPILLHTGLPSLLLGVLVPIGVLGLRDVRRWLVWLPLPFFVVLYAFYTFFLYHYAPVVMLSLITSVLLAIHVVMDAWPRWRTFTLTASVLTIVGLSANELAQGHDLVDRSLWIEPPHVEKVMNDLPHRPALVLFRYRLGVNYHAEPVYNSDVPWPDEAEVIRAHDRGPDNVQIIQYYADRQPERAVYLYDRREGEALYLGTAGDLARQIAATRPAGE